MMCFLAADLVWLFAGLCHALGINTQAGAAVTTAEMLDFSPLCISAHSLPVREAEVDATVNFHKNKQLRVHCIANGEQFHCMCGLSEEMWGLHVHHHFAPLLCKLSRLHREFVLQLIA